jgi:hypothetical protein
MFNTKKSKFVVLLAKNWSQLRTHLNDSFLFINNSITDSPKSYYRLDHLNLYVRQLYIEVSFINPVNNVLCYPKK